MPRTTLITAAWTLVIVAGSASAAERSRGSFEYDPKTKEWVEVAAPEPGTARGDLDVARSLLAERKYPAARDAMKEWRKRYGADPLWPEGVFVSADVEVLAADDDKTNDLWQAHEWYDELLAGYAGTDWSQRAMQRELIVCEMFLFKEKKRKVLKGMLRVSAAEEAIEILNRLADDYAHGTRVAEQALRLQADYYYSRGEFTDAERVYARLARDFPRGRFEKMSMERAADSAMSGFSGVEFDDAPLLEAEERYRQFGDRFPETAKEIGVAQRLQRIRESRAEKELAIARYYERVSEVDSAIYYYRFVARTWPETISAQDARDRLVAIGDTQVPPAPTSGPAGTQPAEPSLPATQPAP